jgi:hypothetical protein
MNEIMTNGLQRYLGKLPQTAQDQYIMLSSFFTEQFGFEPLYIDGSPAFRKGGLVLRVGLFADHANLFVRGSSQVTHFFNASQLTPKGMVQWFYREPFPREIVTQWITAELNA